MTTTGAGGIVTVQSQNDGLHRPWRSPVIRFLSVAKDAPPVDREFREYSDQGWFRFSPGGDAGAFDATPTSDSGLLRTGTATGGYHVYVVALKGDALPMALSLQGGYRPAWRADGAELFFVDSEERLISVTNGANSQQLKPLFTMPRADAFAEYDVSPDGSRFLVNRELRPTIHVTEESH